MGAVNRKIKRQEIEKQNNLETVITGEQVNRRTGEQNNRRTRKQANRRTGEQQNRITLKQGNKRTKEQGNKRSGKQRNLEIPVTKDKCVMLQCKLFLY